MPIFSKIKHQLVLQKEICYIKVGELCLNMPEGRAQIGARAKNKIARGLV